MRISFPNSSPGRRNGGSVIAEVQRTFAQRTRAERVQFFADKNVCCEPVNTLEEALSTPVVKDRGMVWEVGSKESRATA